MKHRFGKCAAFFSMIAAYLLNMPLLVSATDTGNAVKDILNNPRFDGAMSSIKSVTEFVDTWFIRIVTITAFFIISVALLQNVMAAAYVAFPKFWDKVHQAHQNKALWKAISGMGGMAKGMMKKGGGAGPAPGGGGGNMSEALFGILPDIKALTAFADADIPPKQYFTKAIPQMCFMVIIGVFIYNGYYRDVTAKVGDAGASLVEGLLASTDPNVMTDYIFGYSAEPDGAYEADNSFQGQWIRDLSQEMYSALKSNAQVWNSSTEDKEFLLRSAEYWAYLFVTAESGDSSDAATAGAAPGVTWTGNTEGPLFVKTESYVYRMTGLTVTLLNTNNTNAAPSVKTKDTTNQSYQFRVSVPVDVVVANAAADPGLQGKVFSITASMVPETGDYGDNFETKLQAASTTIGGGGTIPVDGVITVTIPASCYTDKVDGDLTKTKIDINQALGAAIIAQIPTTDDKERKFIYSSDLQIAGLSVNGSTEKKTTPVSASELVNKTLKVKVNYTVTDKDGNTSSNYGMIDVQFVQ